jgi:hypothetical protein
VKLTIHLNLVPGSRKLELYLHSPTRLRGMVIKYLSTGRLLPFSEYLSRYSDGVRTGQPEFNSRQCQQISFFSTIPRPALVPTQSPIQWESGEISPGVKRPGLKADHSPSSSAEVKNGGAIPPLPHMYLRHSASLI